MPAQRKGGSLFDHELALRIIGAEELFHHGKRLGAGYHDGVLVKFHERGNIGRVIWLHVLNDQVIGMAVAQKSPDLIQPFLLEMSVHCVHNGDLFVQDDIGIVCHAVRNHVLPFKEIHIMVVDADILDIFGNFHFHALLYSF